MYSAIFYSKFLYKKSLCIMLKILLIMNIIIVMQFFCVLVF